MGKPVIDTHRGDSVFRRDRAGKVLAYRGGAAGDAAGANSSNARTSGRGRGGGPPSHAFASGGILAELSSLPSSSSQQHRHNGRHYYPVKKYNKIRLKSREELSGFLAKLDANSITVLMEDIRDEGEEGVPLKQKIPKKTGCWDCECKASNHQHRYTCFKCGHVYFYHRRYDCR